MANTSVQLINYMLVPSWNFQVCIQEKIFGTMFAYFIMALCILLGTAANLWSLWYYFSVDWKNKNPQVFSLSYIILDLTVCVECAIEILNAFVFNNDKVLLLTFFIFGLSWSGRPLMQTCTSVEQYIAVLYPVAFLRYKGIKYRVPALVTAWLVAFGCGLYYTFALDYYISSVFVLIMSVTVISFCCVSVLRALKHPGPGDANITRQTGRDVGNQQKRKAFNTILSALLIILLAYVPQVLVYIFTVFKRANMFFECNLVPIVLSINFLVVMITPFMNMYKEGQLKCVN